MKIKLKNIQIVAIAMLMVAVTSCNLGDRIDGIIEYDSPISFIFGDIVYSSDIEYYEIFSQEFDSEVNFHQEGPGYDLRIKREGFTSKDSDKKAVLQLRMSNDEDVLELGKAYALQQEGSMVALYYTSYYDDTTEIYEVKEGSITFTKFQRSDGLCSGHFEFAAINDNGEVKSVEGGFEDVWIAGPHHFSITSIGNGDSL